MKIYFWKPKASKVFRIFRVVLLFNYQGSIVRNAFIYRALQIFFFCLGYRFGASAKRSISPCQHKVNHFFQLFFFYFFYNSMDCFNIIRTDLPGIYSFRQIRSIYSMKVLLSTLANPISCVLSHKIVPGYSLMEDNPSLIFIPRSASNISSFCYQFFSCIYIC